MFHCTRVSIVLCNLHNQVPYFIKWEDRMATGIAVLWYGVTLSSSLHLFRFFILGFHLKQKHKERQRILHYLQQTNTALTTGIFIYRCHTSNVPDFGRVFLMLKYTDITQNTYVQSWTVTEIMAREFWNFDSCYSLIDYQIHIKVGRNMWFL